MVGTGACRSVCVVSLEDVLECLIGAEIVDEGDLADDMQEVARQRRQRILDKARLAAEAKAASGGGQS